MGKEDKVFLERLERHHDELRWLYMELYDNDSMFAELSDNLRQFYLARNKELKKSDAQRAENAGWYKQNDMLGMMFYIDNLRQYEGRAVKARLHRTVQCELYPSDAVSRYAQGALRRRVCRIRFSKSAVKAWFNGGLGQSDCRLP